MFHSAILTVYLPHTADDIVRDIRESVDGPVLYETAFEMYARYRLLTAVGGIGQEESHTSLLYHRTELHIVVLCEVLLLTDTEEVQSFHIPVPIGAHPCIDDDWPVDVNRVLTIDEEHTFLLIRRNLLVMRQ